MGEAQKKLKSKSSKLRPDVEVYWKEKQAEYVKWKDDPDGGGEGGKGKRKKTKKTHYQS